MRNKHGFSLIELLVVVLVIGVIASFATAKYQGFIARTRKAEGLRILTALYGAQERYKMENNAYAGGSNCSTYYSVTPSLDVQLSKNPPDNFATPHVCSTTPVAYMQSTIAGASGARLNISDQGIITCTGTAADCSTLGF